MTAKDIVKSAMRKLGVLSSGDDPTADELQDAIETLNTMLKSWSADGLVLHYLSLEGFSLTPGQNTYTIGTGANFNTARPIGIQSAFIRDSNNNDFPIEIVSRQLYQSNETKTSQGRAYQMYYNPAFANGLIYLYWTPEAADTLYLNLKKYLTTFTSQTQDSDTNYPAEYLEAMIYNLAYRLAPEYSVTASSEVVNMANNALGILKRNNFSQRGDMMDEIKIDSGLPGTRMPWNIESM